MPLRSSPNKQSWTVHVHGPAEVNDAPSLVVHGPDLMPLVARLIADDRVQDLVVRPRAREVRARIAAPAAARGEE
jgi:hypothetical protein